MTYTTTVIHTTKTRHIVQVEADSLAEAHEKAKEAAEQDREGLTIWDEYKVMSCHQVIKKEAGK